MNHAADGFALVHQIKGGVDFFQRHGVGDEIAEGELAFHVLADDAGQFAAAFHAAECGAAPHAAGNQLERAGFDLVILPKNN